MSFFASQNASGAKKVCFLMLYEFARVCEAHFFMPGRRCYVKRTEKVLLIVFLVVTLICGKYLLDYWQDSYENRQNYRQVEEIAFPEKDT